MPAVCPLIVAAGLFVRAVVVGFGSAPGFDVNRIRFVEVRFQSLGGIFETGRVQLARSVSRITRKRFEQCRV
jgi:hypothetical protein